MSARYKFKNKSIEIRDYEFYPASVYPHGTIQAEDMLEINLEQTPPVIRLKNELIFISSEKFEQLEAFAKKHKIKQVERFDIWSGILDPSLDTERDFGDRTALINELENYGVGEYEVEELREKLISFMINYDFNTGLWEYVHLGHWDLLLAHLIWLESMSIKLVPKDFMTLRANRNEDQWNANWKGKKVPIKNVTKKEFQDFYWESMEIAIKSYVDE